MSVKNNAEQFLTILPDGKIELSSGVLSIHSVCQLCVDLTDQGRGSGAEVMVANVDQQLLSSVGGRSIYTGEDPSGELHHYVVRIVHHCGL